VPRIIAQHLTYPERVNDRNMAELQQRVKNGPDHLFGAAGVVMHDGTLLDLTLYKEQHKSHDFKLQTGWVVERYLRDGDWVLFNRQPSLHRVSMMVHRADVREHDLAMSLNVEVMAPYGADADGDELNILGLRSEGARVAGLMLTPDKHIFSAKHGDTLIKFQLDSVAGPYYLTLPSTVRS
jgi:DNA-directed RNA polymerase beta' subunit